MTEVSNGDVDYCYQTVNCWGRLAKEQSLQNRITNPVW